MSPQTRKLAAEQTERVSPTLGGLRIGVAMRPRLGRVIHIAHTLLTYILARCIIYTKAYAFS